MKKILTTVTAIALAVMTLISSASACNVYYLKTARVSKIVKDTIYCIDAQGEEWAFMSTDNYVMGQRVNLIMNNNNTANNIYDDMIVFEY